MKTALLLIDLQNDFCTGGALAVKDSDAVIETANDVIALCQENNIPVIATQDWHPANHMSFAENSGKKVGTLGKLNGIPQVWWPNHCIQGEFGAEFHALLNQSAIQEIFRKGENPQIDSYSAFFDNDHNSKTHLDAWLTEQNIQRLLIMGIATDYCVKFTVLDALTLGYETYVIVDGCRGVNIQKEDSQRAFEEMARKGAKLVPQNEIISIL
ncbi:bifunctional nicotinamidase/pyrazinamidase [Xenorhabdus sp. SGI240]|uniref:bifunctional nicotinamidase/pyrazinamidase n=1 Tax=Xenorhabdus sp. SGI240 TaxID=3158262 RepID=UPI0032B7C8A2